MLDDEDRYHVGVIRSKLIKNIAITFDQVQDELVQTLAESIPVTSGGGM
jgi:activator of HSP90 ATPase